MAEVMSIVIASVIGFVILAIGGGAGYWFFIASRPTKMTWKAFVYQVGDGIIESEIRKGKKIVSYRLSDLKEYTLDVVEKIDKKNSATYYWLQKLKKPTPVVTADCVEVWGPKQKYVRILLEQDSCTILKSGYDRLTGKVLFRPMPHDRISMIKTEMSERKDRIDNTKDVLAQITPFIVVGVSMLALGIIGYFFAQASIHQSDTMLEIQESGEAHQTALADKYLMALSGNFSQTQNRKIEIEEPPSIPP